MKILKIDISLLYTFVLYIFKCKKLKITFEGELIKVIQSNIFQIENSFFFVSTDVTIFGGNCHDHSSYESIIVLLDLFFFISYQTF